jgi:hypothetical protein
VVCKVGFTTNWLLRVVSSPRFASMSGPFTPAADDTAEAINAAASTLLSCCSRTSDFHVENATAKEGARAMNHEKRSYRKQSLPQPGSSDSSPSW